MTVSVKILGGGCENCHNLEANARAAAQQLGVAGGRYLDQCVRWVKTVPFDLADDGVPVG